MFALGLTLVELCCGRVVGSGADGFGLARSVREGFALDAAALFERSARADCPPSLAEKNKQHGDDLRQSVQPTSCREKDGGLVQRALGAQVTNGITDPTRPTRPTHLTDLVRTHTGASHQGERLSV